MAVVVLPSDGEGPVTSTERLAPSVGFEAAIMARSVLKASMVPGESCPGDSALRCRRRGPRPSRRRSPTVKVRARRSRGMRPRIGRLNSSRSCSSRRSRGSTACRAKAPPMPRISPAISPANIVSTGRGDTGASGREAVVSTRIVGSPPARSVCRRASCALAVSGPVRPSSSPAATRASSSAMRGSSCARNSAVRSATTARAKAFASCCASRGSPASAVTATMLLCATGAASTRSSRACGLVSSSPRSSITRAATSRVVTRCAAVSTSRVGSLLSRSSDSPLSSRVSEGTGVTRRSASAW